MKNRYDTRYDCALAAALILFALASGPAAMGQAQSNPAQSNPAQAKGAQVDEGDADRGGELGFTCLGCHGIAGYRNAYPSYRVPKLDGQKPAYIEAALKAYRAGSRPHPTMQAQAASLSDRDIADLVAWITRGDAARDEVDAETAGLPEAGRTCVTCHGTAGRDVMPAPPVLSGQHSSYLEHALNQYKAAARGQNVMTAFAAALTPADMEQIAAFYAAREGVRTLGDQASDEASDQAGGARAGD